ncbi:MAG TPA: VCBS repeat-containing protein [Planctomycetota bacterium]|nr:VCBS repeat-containing protein [Planctomycetota bacterium]
MKILSTRSHVLISLVAFAACAKHEGDPVNLVIGAPPAFETRTEITTGSGVHADFFVADFNGDARLDMAVVSMTGELRIMMGTGAGYVLGQQLQIGGLPMWMSGGDFDEDGDQDLVIVRNAANATDVWLNDGNATFTAGASLPVPEGALALAVGDVDDDGNLDVAVTLPEAPRIVVGYGDGDGNFPGVDQLIDLPGGGSAFNVAIGDVTRDGKADVIVSDPELSRVIVFESSKSFGSVYRALSVPGSPAAVALGDLSGDGLTDMAVTAFSSDRYVVITAMQPAGTSWTYSSFDVVVGTTPSIATIADVTGDNRNDLAGCLAWTQNVFVAPGLLGGGVGEPSLLDNSGYPLRPFVGDSDGNGKNDLFVLSGGGSRVNLWYAKNTGQLAGAHNYSSGLPGASWIEGADFDGDGDFEIATACKDDNRFTLLGRTPGGGLDVEFSRSIGQPIYQLEAADLNSDGRVDLVVGVSGGVLLLRNNSVSGTYSFEVMTGLPIGSATAPFGIAVGDFDLDGDYDIAVCDHAGGGVHVISGTQTPFVFGAEDVVEVGGGPVDVAAADFTGDGLVDLAVSRQELSDIVILRNGGAAGFEQFVSVPVGATPNYLITADFDRDGRADLVVSNANSGSVSVLFGITNGFSGQTYPAGAAPTALLAKDLTGDGMVDVLVASLTRGDFRVMVGDGQGSFPQLYEFPGTFGASDAVLQDMDGDSRPDLLIASLVTNRVSLVRNIRE